MFTDPEKNLKIFGIKENDIVVDLGAGTGFYTVLASKMATSGKVYAVEIGKDFLETIRNKAKTEQLKNVECIWGDIEKVGGTKLADGIADKIIMSNVLFPVEDKERFLEETKRILKKGGEILLIDWSDGASPIGPNTKNFIPDDRARALLEEKGFIFKRDIPTGEHHYGMIFSKK